jgi:hypothetical protein
MLPAISELKLSLLLWALFVGATVLNDFRSERALLPVLHQLCAALSIKTYEDFCTYLKEVVWLDSFCIPQSINVWQKLNPDGLAVSEP